MSEVGVNNDSIELVASGAKLASPGKFGGVSIISQAILPISITGSFKSMPGIFFKSTIIKQLLSPNGAIISVVFSKSTSVI